MFWDATNLQGNRGPSNIGIPEQTDFYNLNQLVKASNTQPEITEIIDEWYGNLGTGFNSSTTNYFKAPPGWSGNVAFYENVVAKSCRTCHIALGRNPSTDISWHTAASFNNNSYKFIVCDQNGNIMPHALMTYRNFWLEGMGSPYEPTELASFYGPSQVCE